jgi:hypothetical protein
MQLPSYAQGFFDGYQAGFQAAMAGGQFRPELGPAQPIVPLAPVSEPPKRKRKVSKYARTYGAAYRALKKKHPRSKHATLVKRAHAEARRKMKK